MVWTAHIWEYSPQARIVVARDARLGDLGFSLVRLTLDRHLTRGMVWCLQPRVERLLHLVPLCSAKEVQHFPFCKVFSQP